MGLFRLAVVNMNRNWVRTLLTQGSVLVALFLFCALGGVLDTLDDAIEVGSETRLVSRNAISLVFPLPQSYRERIAAIPGVKRVALENWFGANDPSDTRGFFAQFAVDPVFFRIYEDDLEIVEASPPAVEAAVPEGLDPKLASYLQEQTACVVGRKLAEKKGWKLGQTITLVGTIFPGEWPFTIRAIYAAKKKSWGEESFFFPYRYLEQKGMGGQGWVGVYVLELDDPAQAPDIARQVDALFENSSAATRTESEQAFQAGFVSMYGNIPFVLRVIGFAVVFAILLVAANTMVMAVRERTSEIGVMKTLGFEDGTVFRLVLIEAAMVTFGGGVLGALFAKFLLESTGFSFGGLLPPISIHWSTVFLGVGIALLVGAVSGLIPAWQASRLRIVDALRRVE